MNERIVTELVIDAQGSVTGAAQYINAMRSAERERNKAADAEFKIQQATENSTTAMVGYGNSVAKVRSDFDRLKATTDPVFAAQIRHNRELERAVMQTAAAVRRGVAAEVEGAAVVSALRARQLAEINSLKAAQASLGNGQFGRGVNQFNTANLAAQFQDIGVTAAMGMNPLQIALQQGTQISAVLGPMGAAGAVKSLGAAFASVVNPVSLLTIGVVALGAALVQYFMSGEDGVKSLDEAFKLHEATLDRIDRRYAGFSERLTEYRDSSALLGAVVRDSLAVMEAAARGENQSLIDELIPMREFDARTSTIRSFVREGLQPFQQAIFDLDASIAAGSPNFVRFQQQIEAMVATDPTNLRAVGDEILLLGQEAFRAEAGVKAAKEAVEGIGGSAQAQVESVDGLSGALERLANIALPALSLAEQAEAAFREATANATDMAGRRAALDQFEQAMERIRNKQAGASVPIPTTRPNDIEMGNTGPNTGFSVDPRTGVGVGRFGEGAGQFTASGSNAGKPKYVIPSGMTEDMLPQTDFYDYVRDGLNDSSLADSLSQSNLYGSRGFGAIPDLGRDLGIHIGGLGQSVGSGLRQINTTMENLPNVLAALAAEGITNPQINYQMAGDNPFGSTLSESRKRITALGHGQRGTGSRVGEMLEAAKFSPRTVTAEASTFSGPITLVYQASPGESEKTSRQRARDMLDELRREAARA